MAVVEVSRKRGGAAALHYAGDNNAPHVGDQYVTHRVLASSGINCDPDYAVNQMGAVWDYNDTQNKGRVEAYGVIVSFSKRELDYRKQEDRQKALAVAERSMSKLYPDRQVAMYLQADNEEHLLHVHCIVNSINPITNKAIRGRYLSNQGYIAHVNDQSMDELGVARDPDSKDVTITKHTTKSGEVVNDYNVNASKTSEPIAQKKMQERGEKSYMATYRDALNAVLDDQRCVDFNSASELLKQRGVDLRLRYKKKNRKPTNQVNGLSVAMLNWKDKNGNAKKYVTRGSKLGRAYTVDAFEQAFKRHKTRTKTNVKTSVASSATSNATQVSSVTSHPNSLAHSMTASQINASLSASSKASARAEIAQLQNKSRDDLAKVENNKPKYEFSSAKASLTRSKAVSANRSLARSKASSFSSPLTKSKTESGSNDQLTASELKYYRQRRHEQFVALQVPHPSTLALFKKYVKALVAHLWQAYKAVRAEEERKQPNKDDSKNKNNDHDLDL